MVIQCFSSLVYWFYDILVQKTAAKVDNLTCSCQPEHATNINKTQPFSPFYAFRKHHNQSGNFLPTFLTRSLTS